VPSPSLPQALQALLTDALSPPLPTGRRLRALATLERAAADHRTAIATALVPLLAEGPDLAARVHVALLVLSPTLLVGRDEDGAFVAAAGADLPGDGADGFLDPDVGRVVPLDRLVRLYGPDEDPPLFLSPPPRTAPLPYRSPEVLRAEALEHLLIEKAAARAAFTERLTLLGLEHGDLDDDDHHHDGPRLLRPPRPLTPLPPIAELHDEDDIVLTVDGERARLGRALPGAWWHEERAGDHRGARRFMVGRRVDEHLPLQTRRERTVDARAIAIEVGPHVVQLALPGRRAVVFVDAVDDDVVAVTVTWSNHAAFKPGAKTELRPKTRPRL
jgi:hypothetical protein